MSERSLTTRIVPPDRAAIRAALELTDARPRTHAPRRSRRGLALLAAVAIGVGVALAGSRGDDTRAKPRVVAANVDSVAVVRVAADGPLAPRANRGEQRAVVRLRLATETGPIDVDAAQHAILAWLRQCSSHAVLEAAAGSDIELRERIATALQLSSPAALALDWESLELR